MVDQRPQQRRKYRVKLHVVSRFCYVVRMCKDPSVIYILIFHQATFISADSLLLMNIFQQCHYYPCHQEYTA